MLRLVKKARRAHGATVDEYNAMPLPTLQELAEQLTGNRWLCAVVQQIVDDCPQSAPPVEGSRVIPDMFRDHELSNLAYHKLVAAVPYLRRLGYAVTLFSDESSHHPFNVEFLGHPKPHLVDLQEDLWKHARLEECEFGHPYEIRMHGTSPKQIRRRGLLKCVPRLLGWLRQARIALADPSRPGAMAALAAEREAELADDAPPHWETEASVQGKRKRELVDALHASDEDVCKGARWADVRFSTDGVTDDFVHPMRIEALAGDHFVFQHNLMGSNYRHEVVVLHRDAFTVKPWPTQDWRKDGCEQLFDFRFREDGDDVPN